jgi:hypothetical protein
VRIGGKRKLINIEGKETSNTRYDYISPPNQYNIRYISVNKKRGLLDFE